MAATHGGDESNQAAAKCSASASLQRTHGAAPGAKGRGSDTPVDRKISPQCDGLWLYAGDRGDGGVIKWMSATERDGTCGLPSRGDLVIFAKACAGTFPKCRSGKP